jgi:phosphopantothenate---cysteine ligase (CTP)
MENKQLKILIASGGTVEKIDGVRGLTNFARGTIGCLFADLAVSKGHSVTFLHGYFSKIPNNNNIELIPFTGIHDLYDSVKNLLTKRKFDVMIMSAAGSDWIVDKLIDNNGNIIDSSGKISSDNVPLLQLKKAPKILADIKKWDPSIFLIGFKLEHNDDKEYLIQRSIKRMGQSKSNIMVANSYKSLFDNSTEHYIIDEHYNVKTLNTKEDVANHIINMISDGEIR